MDIIIVAAVAFVIIVALVVITPTVRMALSIAPFLYTNTRCSARTGLILDRKAYDSLLATAYTKELCVLLEGMGYGHVVERGQDFPTISPLLDKDLKTTYEWLESVVPQELQKVVKAMRRKFEVHDIKEGLNRLATGGTVGELPGVLDTNLRLKLEAATDYGSFASALEGTEYDVAFQSEENIATVLDAHHLHRVLKEIEAVKDDQAAAPFKEFWRRVIDIGNLRLVLRKINDGSSAKLIEGGFLPVDRLSPVSDASQLSEALQGTPFASIAADTDIETEVHRVLHREAGMVSARHPLKGGPVVRFIIQKELEVRNLNVILKLKAEQFKTDEISPLVIS